MSEEVPIAYSVPVSIAVPVAQALPVTQALPLSQALNEELSEKEWLQKYYPGRYEYKEEDIKGFPYSVQNFIRTWTKVDDSYLFFTSNIPYDDANKKAAAVLDVRGTDAAVQYMMGMANGSYSQMRSMYG
jgi:hypothetical protein